MLVMHSCDHDMCNLDFAKPRWDLGSEIVFCEYSLTLREALGGVPTESQKVRQRHAKTRQRQANHLVVLCGTEWFDLSVRTFQPHAGGTWTPYGFGDNHGLGADDQYV